MTIRTSTIRSRKSLLYKPTINRINKFFYELKNNSIDGKNISWWVKRKLKMAIKNKDISKILEIGDDFFNMDGISNFNVNEIITDDGQQGYELIIYGVPFIFI